MLHIIAMATEASLEELAHPKYWDARYALEQKNKAEAPHGTLASYDWFRTFDEIRPLLLKYLPPAMDDIRILHLGCGNSVSPLSTLRIYSTNKTVSLQTLTSDLYKLKYRNQISIDFSSIVIEAMSAKYAKLGMQWHVMDVRKLQFPDSCFDVTIDKVGGSIEALATHC